MKELQWLPAAGGTGFGVVGVRSSRCGNRGEVAARRQGAAAPGQRVEGRRVCPPANTAQAKMDDFFPGWSVQSEGALPCCVIPGWYLGCVHSPPSFLGPAVDETVTRVSICVVLGL